MREKWILLAAVMAILVLSGTGLWQGSCPLRTEKRGAAEPAEIVIGALLPLSGSTGSYGENARSAIDLAVEQANDSGGIDGKRIRIVYEDTEATPSVGVGAFERLVATEPVAAAIGPMSSPVAMAVAPLAEEMKTVILSPSASTPDLTEAGDYVFRDCLSDEYEGVALAGLALDTLGYETGALFYIDNAYGHGLADVFAEAYERRGGMLVARETFAEDATDFSEPLARIAAAQPDVIVLIGYAQMGEILIEARSAGLTQQVLSSVMFDNPAILATAGAAAEGVLFTTWTPDPADPSPELAAFENAYRVKYAAAPGIFGAESYDAANLLIEAIRARGDTADAIRDGLYATQAYRGASGTISFDENGDCIKPIYVKRVEGGEFVYTTS